MMGGQCCVNAYEGVIGGDVGGGFEAIEGLLVLLCGQHAAPQFIQRFDIAWIEL
jgi:hypothetical protein